ncbi:hypothetical protein BDY19DRAFT_305291 [Irpex rosettiformis]|uniref:Uncharacterized protein n=1 Tax=Irpex rosettiformis TaxID=378272 RepID=A0ACB8TYU3_9APHY|nr:hypothetical protein BDY19DRAFT_305291 [Irpex rosettiformis]
MHFTITALHICPIDQGKHTLAQTVTLPEFIVDMLYAVDANGHTVNDNPIFCFHISAGFRD